MVHDVHFIEANGRAYLAVEDLTTRFEVLVAGQVTSAASGLPLQAFEVEVGRGDVFVKVMRDGYFCLAGVTERLFPDLATTAYSLELTVHAMRYLPVSVTIPIPAGSAFPLMPMAVGMEYEPLRIQGRVTMALDDSPVPEARVTIDEPGLLTLRTPLHFDHEGGTTVRSCTLAPAGSLRALTQSASYGAGALVLDDNSGLAGGSVLRIGSAVQFEFMVTDSSGPGAGEVLLRGGILRSYPPGTNVQPVSPAPGADTRSLDRTARAGTGLLWLNSPLTASSVMLEDADPAEQEYHALDALSDSHAGREGFYRLDGIAGLQTLNLRAENPANTHEHELGWSVKPMQPVNTVNFRLAPP